MSGLDLEAEYNNSARVPDFPRIAEGWRGASASYRARARADLDVPYGAGERQCFDLFAASRADAPTVVYLHGGYWQGGDRTLYAFIAEALNRAGLRVAIPSYSLCPQVSVTDIVEEIRAFVGVWWRRHGEAPLLVGHSAGGHLAAAMLATDWSSRGLPSDAVRGAVTISGVFELEPLVATSINAALALDPATARAVSPALWTPPAPGRVLWAAVGGDESSEFKRQSRELVARWSAAGVRASYEEIPAANHFTVLDALARPGGRLHDRVCALAGG